MNTDMAPTVGMPVKLKRRMNLTLSAKQIQRVKAVKKLTLDNVAAHGLDTQELIDAEGGYWIKTDYTSGEWWAWSLFRVA